MKKILSIVLVAVMLCMVCCTAVAEETTTGFDKSKLENSRLYSYDKFTKEWNIQGQYTKKYRDATVEVCLLLFDEYVTEQYGPELRIYYFDKDENTYDKVTAFRAIVGETMFCFETLAEGTNAGYALSCPTLESFCNALIMGKTIAFQIDHTDKFGNRWTSTIDPVEIEELTDLIDMAKLLKDSNAWTISTYSDVFEAMLGASIE